MNNELSAFKKTIGFSKTFFERKESLFLCLNDGVSSFQGTHHGDFNRKKAREKRNAQSDQTPDTGSLSFAAKLNLGKLSNRSHTESTGKLHPRGFSKQFKTNDRERETLKVDFIFLFKENRKYLRKRVFKPYLKMLCMRMILFYQKHLSKHTCLYRPTCSQYTLESINNRGVFLGVLLGAWRILRCNPFSKGGYDPALERRGKKWLL